MFENNNKSFPFFAGKFKYAMKLVSYLKDNHEQLAVLIDGFVYDMEVLHPDLPNTMNMFLTYWEDAFPVAQAGELMLKEGTRTSNKRKAAG